MLAAINQPSPYSDVVRDKPRLSPSLAQHNYQRIIEATKGSGIHVLRWLAISPYFFPTNQYDDPEYYQNFIEHMSQLIPLLIEQHTLNFTVFQEFFSPIATIDPLIQETIVYGVGLYFNKEYLGCIYILTLQLEDALRILLELHHGDIYEITRNGREKRPLGRVMRDLKPILPGGVYYYAMWLLKDKAGLRLRDTVAHGLFKTNKARPLYATTLIHLLCILNVLIEHEQQQQQLAA